MALYTVEVGAQLHITVPDIEASSPVQAEDEAVQAIEDWLAEAPYATGVEGSFDLDSYEQDDE